MNNETKGSIQQLMDLSVQAQRAFLSNDEDALTDAMTTIGLISRHVLVGRVEEYLNSPKPIAEQFAETWSDLSTLVWMANEEKGFWPDDRNQAEAIALVHSELSEALEALRHGNPPSEKIDGYTHAEEEYADAVIRLLDIGGGFGHEIGGAVAAKLNYNATRPHKHGKEF